MQAARSVFRATGVHGVLTGELSQADFLVAERVVRAAVMPLIGTRGPSYVAVGDLGRTAGRAVLRGVHNHRVLVHLIVGRGVGGGCSLVLELLVAHPLLVGRKLLLRLLVLALVAPVETEGNAAADENGCDSSTGDSCAT
jgi:hypothetical protein